MRILKCSPKEKYKHKNDIILLNINKDIKTKCWNWTLQIDRDGYGRVKYKGKKHGAHRISYLTFKGELIKGMCICHHCDNPSCVNPDHLYQGTFADNNRDRARRGRSNQVGEANNGAKLTNKKVIEIRKKYKTGEYTQQGLADYYGVTQHAIWDIVHFNTWEKV